MNDSLADYIHFISDAPQTQQTSDKTKASLLATLQKKKECEERAMKTLEFLIEGKIREEVFLRCINYLSRSHYLDIIEERSITKLCGYCRCDNKIPTMTKKQFAIDSKNNKVYDVTNRKKYCSNYCYKASIHIEQQIDNSPLWLRDPANCPKYTLLPRTDRGIPGDDLSLDPVAPTEQIPFQSAFSFVEVSLKDITGEKPIESPKEDVSVTENLVNEESKNAEDIKKQTVNKKVKAKRKNKIQLLKQYVLEWLTVDTYMFLFGEERVKECMNVLNLSNISEATKLQQKELVQLCRRLNLSNSTKTKIERTFLDKELKPIPSYKEIKNENKGMNVKVRSFYGGNTYEVEDKEASQSMKDEESIQDVVPISGSPNAVRQNVFLNSIKNSMKILSENLDISWPLVLKNLEELVKTFALQPHSVVFQPVEWNFISLIMIRMLSFRDPRIKEHLNTIKCETFMTQSISSFPGIQSILNDLFTRIEDINSFLQQHFHLTE